MPSLKQELPFFAHLFDEEMTAVVRDIDTAAPPGPAAEYANIVRVRIREIM